MQTGVLGHLGILNKFDIKWWAGRQKEWWTELKSLIAYWEITGRLSFRFSIVENFCKSAEVNQLWDHRKRRNILEVFSCQGCSPCCLLPSELRQPNVPVAEVSTLVLREKCQNEIFPSSAPTHSEVELCGWIACCQVSASSASCLMPSWRVRQNSQMMGLSSFPPPTLLLSSPPWTCLVLFGCFDLTFQIKVMPKLTCPFSTSYPRQPSAWCYSCLWWLRSNSGSQNISSWV